MVQRMIEIEKHTLYSSNSYFHPDYHYHYHYHPLHERTQIDVHDACSRCQVIEEEH